jgi:hypothetical protein
MRELNISVTGDLRNTLQGLVESTPLSIIVDGKPVVGATLRFEKGEQPGATRAIVLECRTAD